MRSGEFRPNKLPTQDLGETFGAAGNHDVSFDAGFSIERGPEMGFGSGIDDSSFDTELESWVEDYQKADSIVPMSPQDVLVDIASRVDRGQIEPDVALGVLDRLGIDIA